MKKIKMTNTKDQFLRDIIASSAAYYRVDPEEQARIAGVSKATWYRRLAKPENFTVREIRRMGDKYNWSQHILQDIFGFKEKNVWDE